MVNTILSVTAITALLVIAIRAGSNIRKAAKNEKDLYLKSNHYDKNRNNKPMHGIKKAGDKTWRYN